MYTIESEETLTFQADETMALINQALDFANSDKIRPDHCDGEHSLYRFAAYINLNKFVPYFYESNEFKYILNYLSNLPVKPYRIFVDFTGGISIDWFPSDALVVTSKAQYVKLIMEFQMFLQTYSSPFFTFEMQEGFLNDDPNERISNYPSEELNFNPKFDAECFGSNKEIEVIQC